MQSDDAAVAARQAIEFFDKTCAPSDFLHDLTKSLCLLVKDAERFYYIHRTFQEYFVALFLSKENFDGWEDVVEEISVKNLNDSCIRMMIEIDRFRFDTIYLKKKLIELLDQIDRINDDDVKVFELFFGSFSWEGNRCGPIAIANISNFSTLKVLEQDPLCSVHNATIFSGSWPSLRSKKSFDGMIDPAKLTKDVIRNSPLAKYVTAIKESIQRRLTSIEMLEQKRSELVRKNLMDNILLRKNLTGKQIDERED